MKTILSSLTIASLLLLPFAGAQDLTIKSSEVYAYAGVPASGTSEIDTLTIAASTSAGTFTITVADGRTTAPIAWSATNATLLSNIDNALEALSVIGTGGVVTAESSLTAGIGTITLTLAGKNAKQNFPALSIGTNSLTGGAAPTLTTTTAGVDATFRNAPTGTLLVNTTTPTLYQNTSTTVGSPTWTSLSGAVAELNTLAAAIPTVAVADVSTTDATDDATVWALANALKVKINDALAKLRTAGIITP